MQRLEPEGPRECQRGVLKRRDFRWLVMCNQALSPSRLVHALLFQGFLQLFLIRLETLKRTVSKLQGKPI